MRRFITTLLILVLSISCFAQGPVIRKFKGVVSNADLEDIDKENAVELKNMRPRNGKLVKTFGFGNDNTASDISMFTLGLITRPYNLYTYVHDELHDGRVVMIVAYVPDDSTTRIYGHNDSMGIWENINLLDYVDESQEFSIDDSFYVFNDTLNPIIQSGSIIRFLPGNVGKFKGKQSAGLWIDFIDRFYFDSLFVPTKQFYGYPTTIEPAVLSITQDTVLIPSGFDSWIKRRDSALGQIPIFYKISYVYDGGQESLLSGAIKWGIPDSAATVLLKAIIVEADFNKRITAIKVYRSDFSESNYRLIHTIDFLRTDDDYYGDVELGYAGTNAAYVPELSGYDFTDTYGFYRIRITSGGNNDTLYIGDNYSGLGNDAFHKDVDADNYLLNYGIIDTIDHNHWAIGAWTLDGDTVKGSGRWLNGLTSGLTSYSGINTIVVNDSIYGDYIPDSTIFLYKVGLTRYWYPTNVIRGKAVYILNERVANNDTSSNFWHLYLPENGSYAFVDSGASTELLFLDLNFVPFASHPLEGEVSIDVNGKFAKIIQGRLWQGDVVLDPFGVAEVHKDWVLYSELEQYDVNSVKNVLSIANFGVGNITGIDEVYGNPVVLRDNAMIFVNIKDNPGVPASWSVREVKHNIGNIASNGYINVRGLLYVCWYNGIYRFAPNNLAESDFTPTEALRISEPINDVYGALSLNEKRDIRVGYDQSKSEIVFVLGDENWAWSILYMEWREIESSNGPLSGKKTIGITALDEKYNLIVYDKTNLFVYDFTIDDTVGFSYRTKTFYLSDEEPADVVRAWITYNSTNKLYVNLFTNNSTIVAKTDTLTPSGVDTTVMVSFNEPANKFSLQFIDSLNTKNSSEIHKVKVIIQ